MATYVNNLRLKEIATGDESGTWGTSTNTNLELIGEGFGYGTQEVAADVNETFTMADGAADGVRGMYLKFTSAGALTATRELTLAPNTVSKVWIIENATTGSQIITIKQGAGATINIASGAKKMVYTDGAGSGAAVFDANTTVGTAATITVANEATDTTCFPAFFTAATGDLGPKSNTGLTYNSATNALGVGILTVGNLQTLSTGADIASATATDLTAATGNVVVITGTATATSLTMTAGQQMVLLPSAAWPLTYHATTMNITGGVSYTCAAGDRIYAVKDLAGVIRVSVFKQDGTAVVPGAAGSVAVGDITGAGTGVLTALAVNVGSAGAPVVLDGALGTPSGGTATNLTGLPPAGVTGTAAILGANTFTGEQFFVETKDTVYTISDGAAFEIDPVNGNIQVVTLGANRSPLASNFVAGQAILMGVDDGATYAITWPSVTWVVSGGTGVAPDLATTGYTWVMLFKQGSTLFGTIVGSP